MLRVFAILAAFAVFTMPTTADTLADMRQDLADLLAKTQNIHRELINTRDAGFQNDGSLLDRIAVIELELQRLTSQTESLSIRIAAIVADATTRIGQLEVRICAQEPGCVVSKLGATLPVGIDDTSISASDTGRPAAVLAITEKVEFEEALAAFTSGDTGTAVILFQGFIASFPLGPLTQNAHLHLAHAYLETESYKLAAREYLEAFSMDETTDVAPTALYNLAIAFHKMGKAKEACLTLDEVQFRFEGEEAAQDAKDAAVELSCA